MAVHILDSFVGKEIEVTQDDIDCSKRRDVHRCALANAIRRLLGDDFNYVSVMPTCVGIGYTKYVSDRKYIMLDKMIDEWRLFYDAYVHIPKPCKIVLDRLVNPPDWHQPCDYIFRMA